MVKRIVAIGFIWLCTAIAWAILGSTIFYRTYSSDTQQLRARVASSWGTPQEQTPPTAGYQMVSHKQVPGTKDGVPVVRDVEEKTWYPASHRKKPGQRGAPARLPPQRPAVVQHLPSGFQWRLRIQQSQRPAAAGNIQNEAARRASRLRQPDLRSQRSFRSRSPTKKTKPSPPSHSAQRNRRTESGLPLPRTGQLELQLRRRRHAGKRLSTARHHEFPHLRSARKHALAHRRAQRTERLGSRVELQEPRFRLSRGHRSAAEAAARTARRAHQLFCSGLTAVFLLRCSSS